MNETQTVNQIINHMNVFVRRAIYDIVPLGWEIFERIIFDYEIIFISEGHCYAKIEDREYHARQGDLLFIKPNVRHLIKAEGTTRLHQPHIHFDLQYDKNSEKVYIPIAKNADTSNDLQLLRKNVTNEHQLYIKEYFSFSESAPYVRNLILHIIELQNALDSASTVRKNAYLLELISYLIAQSEQNSPVVRYEQDIFERVNALIESSYNKPFSLTNILNQIGYSKNYFTHLYKQHFGQTPKAYHEQLRIDKSISYLSMPDINVTEIAATLGFETIHDFSRFFKRKTGLSPSDYRLSMHTQNNSDP